MSYRGWQPWQIPPFSAYISKEDQELCAETSRMIEHLNHRVFIPAAGFVDLLLDTLLANRNAKMVKP